MGPLPAMPYWKHVTLDASAVTTGFIRRSPPNGRSNNARRACSFRRRRSVGLSPGLPAQGIWWGELESPALAIPSGVGALLIVRVAGASHGMAAR